MGGPTRITNNELLEILLPEIRKTGEKQDQMSERLAVFEERQGKILRSIRKLEEAIYGNGKPGLRADVDALDSRLSYIEQLHYEEKMKREQNEVAVLEAKKAEKSEWRKFRWGLLATGFTVLLDLILIGLAFPVNKI